MTRFATAPTRVTGPTPTPTTVPSRARGEALPASARATMEARFGHDFGRVRVHADADAAASARALRAQAYTVGDDIAFAAGRYAPGSEPGRALLAHELAHVVQQARGGDGVEAEARADDAAADAMQGRRVDHDRLGGAPRGVQRKPDGDAPSGTSDAVDVDLEPGESIGRDNAKIARLAAAYRRAGDVRVRLSANLSEDGTYDTAKANAQRGMLGARMRAVRDALQAPGVPFDAIDLSPATAFATSAHGQVSAAIARRGSSLPFLLAPTGIPLKPGVPPAPSTGGLPSIDLDVTIGPVTISLPKEVKLHLPVVLRHGRRLVIDLDAKAPGSFALSIALDGTPHVRVSLTAGADVDPKSGGATASGGLKIETVAAVCDAVDPNETRAKITASGDKLDKAAQELQAATSDSDKLSKAIDVASAIAEIYDAVDKAKAKCKQVPRATLEFGYKRRLAPGDETDPTKIPPLDYVGGTATFHF